MSFYEISNKSNKPIESYRIARWYSDGAGFEGFGTLPDNDSFLMPNEKVGTIPNNIKVENKEEKNESPKTVAFIMVVEVTFADGSKYRADKNFDSLEQILQSFRKIPWEF